MSNKACSRRTCINLLYITVATKLQRKLFSSACTKNERKNEICTVETDVFRRRKSSPAGCLVRSVGWEGSKAGTEGSPPQAEPSSPRPTAGSRNWELDLQLWFPGKKRRHVGDEWSNTDRRRWNTSSWWESLLFSWVEWKWIIIVEQTFSLFSHFLIYYTRKTTAFRFFCHCKNE